MDLVIDTNSLFTFFWKGSLIKKLVIAGHNIYAPEFALEELKNHKTEIIKKTNISNKEFDELIDALQILIKFIPFSEYADYIPEAFNLLPEHPKDIDFLALAIKLCAAIVFNDRELNEQTRVKIFSKSRFPELQRIRLI